MIALLLTGQISNGQYIKAKKGDVVPFDTAVITNITQYRAETEKLKTADTLLKGYREEVKNLYAEISIQAGMITESQAGIASRERLLLSKEETITRLNSQFIEMAKLAAAPRRTWWVKNKVWVGLVAGLAGGYYICTKIN